MQVRELEVCEDLGQEYGGNRVGSLYLDNHLVIDHEIESIADGDDFLSVNDWNCYLSAVGDPFMSKFAGEASLIDTFKQSRAQDAMNRYRTCDNVFGSLNMRIERHLLS